jgi:hypothetical protein
MAEPTSPSRQNLRRVRRLPSKGSTKVKAYRNALGLGPNIAVRPLDISEHGVRLVLKEELPTNHEFEIVLEGSTLQPFKCLANVVWCIKAEDGTHLVGASLQKHVPYVLLSAMARA